MYKTSKLLSNVRRKANIPATQATFSDAELLEYADERIMSSLVPLMITTREEYFVAEMDYPITSTLKDIRIPSNCIASRIRDIFHVDSTHKQDLTRIQPEDAEENKATGEAAGFYLQNDRAIFYPQPSESTGVIKLTYFARPNDLVAESATAVVTGVDGDTLHLSHVPNNFEINSRVDIISGQGLNSYVYQGNRLETVEGTQVTLTTDVEGIEVGDEIALAGQSSFVQFIPEDLMPWLEELVCMNIYEAQGDDPAFEKSARRVKVLQENAAEILTPRVEGAPKIIVSRKWRRY